MKVRLVMYRPQLSDYEQLRKPTRSSYNHDGIAMERDVKDALHQALSGLSYLLKTNSKVLDKRGNPFKIDVIVADRRSSRRYAIIECKNIRSKNPITNESELRKAAHPLSFFRDEKRTLKICVVNKRRRISDPAKRKIDHLYKFQVHGKIYDWSTDFDWLKMAYSIRKAILRHWRWKEDLETYAKLVSYNRDYLGGKNHRRFLAEIGLKRGAHGAVYVLKAKGYL